MTVAVSTPPSTSPPSKYGGDPVAFDAAMQAHLSWQVGMIAALNLQNAENNTLNANVNAQTSVATAKATAAAASALVAGATLWVSGTTYAIGNARYSPINGQTYRRLTAGAGTTDPSADATNWIVVNGVTSEAIVLPTNNLPVIRPTLNLDFGNAQVVDLCITFTRASTATRVNDKGLIEIVASGMPRIDYAPVTLECSGLLVEGTRTNLLTYSENFDNTAWTKTRCSVTANVTIAPDGTLTADKVVEDTTASNSHFTNYTSTLTASTVHTFYVFAKSDARAVLDIIVGQGTTYTARAFNLSSGASETNKSGITDAGLTNSSITAVGGGWYRCTVTMSATEASTVGTAQIRLTNGTSAIYTGDGTSGLYIWGAQLEAGAFPTSYIPSTETHTGRASTATYCNSLGQIAVASSGVARLNYNPANLTVAPKLLLEAAGTNLFTYSEEFNNIVWVKFNATVTANAVASPDGTTTADKLVENSSNALHQISYSIGAGSVVTRTFTAYLKPDTRTKVEIILYNTLGYAIGTFDLISGEKENPTYYLFANVSVFIEPVGNDWYRCGIIATPNDTSNLYAVIRLMSGTVDSYTGDGTSGMYVWGAQLELNSYATSYIPTVAAQVTRVADTSTSAQTTRAADVAVITGTNFSSWYRQDEGTFVVGFDHAAPATTGYDRLFHVGSSNNSIVCCKANGDGRFFTSITKFGVDQGYLYTSTLTANSMSFFSFAYKTDDFAKSHNGGAVVTDSTVDMPTLSTMYIGNYSQAQNLNGHIKSIRYYPQRLSNATLQALSIP